jgi:hypothetical protein
LEKLVLGHRCTTQSVMLCLAGEKEAQEKRKAKLESKKAAEGTKDKLGVKAAATKKTKKKAIRIKKNVIIRVGWRSELMPPKAATSMLWPDHKAASTT